MLPREPSIVTLLSEWLQWKSTTLATVRHPFPRGSLHSITDQSWCTNAPPPALIWDTSEWPSQFWSNHAMASEPILYISAQPCFHWSPDHSVMNTVHNNLHVTLVFFFFPLQGSQSATVESVAVKWSGALTHPYLLIVRSLGMRERQVGSCTK